MADKHDSLHTGTGCNCMCRACWYQWTVTTSTGQARTVGVSLCPQPPAWFRAL